MLDVPVSRGPGGVISTGSITRRGDHPARRSPGRSITRRLDHPEARSPGSRSVHRLAHHTVLHPHGTHVGEACLLEEDAAALVEDRRPVLAPGNCLVTVEDQRGVWSSLVDQSLLEGAVGVGDVSLVGREGVEPRAPTAPNTPLCRSASRVNAAPGVRIQWLDLVIAHRVRAFVVISRTDPRRPGQGGPTRRHGAPAVTIEVTCDVQWRQAARPPQDPSSGVKMWPAAPVWLGATEDLAGDRSDFTNAEQQESEQVADRIAFGPLDVEMRTYAGAVAHCQQQGGERVRDARGTRREHPIGAVHHLSVYVEHRLE